ncbi:MAG TPA: FeoB-associated Cys-rich membrane protein [Lachnospiraceae bacterium]|jgi:hypothetical protein|nr:FeoB-associated Cys-rich membrane protein [Lachnospiraceae bacterium]
MNLLDLFLILTLIMVFALAVFLWVRGRKKGNGCYGCSGDCSSCGNMHGLRKQHAYDAEEQ